MGDGYALQLSDAELARYRQMAERALEMEADRWTSAGVVPGARIADVGCGPGAILAELATIAGPSGEAVGVEPDPIARDAARQYLDERGLGHVHVREGRGDATGLEPDAWDVVMMRHVLVHTGFTAPAIVEHLASLVRPGGHVYLIDVDLDGGRTTPHDDGMTEQLSAYTAFHRARGNDVRMGPRLPVLLQDAGLDVVDAAGWFVTLPAATIVSGGPWVASQDAMIAEGFLDPNDVDRWADARQRFAAIPGGMVWLPQFVAVGRRPS
jgi:SAM-dependent methyltransferase